MRYIVFATLYCHRHNRLHALEGVQLHFSICQRIVGYRSPDQKVLAYYALTLRSPRDCIRDRCMAISWSQAFPAHHRDSNSLMGSLRICVAVLPDAFARSHRVIHRHHALNICRHDCSPDTSIHCIRVWCPRKVVSFLLNLDDPRSSNLWRFGRAAGTIGRRTAADPLAWSCGARKRLFIHNMGACACSRSLADRKGNRIYIITSMYAF